jgi:hypothetical protein
MKKKNIETIFSSMEDFSSIPPPELWNQIEAQLDQPKQKKRSLLLWWSVAACLLIGLAIPSVMHFNASPTFVNPNGIPSSTTKVVLEKKNPKAIENKAILNRNKLAVQPNAIQNKPAVSIIKNQEKQIVSNINTAAKIPVFYTPKQVDAKASTSKNANQETATVFEPNTVVNRGQNKPANSSSQNGLTPNATVKTNDEVAIGLAPKTESTADFASKTADANQNADLKKLENALVEKENLKLVLPNSETQKWSVQVFAGVSSTQNYKNEKALGSTIDSKQGTVYGVKTDYKLNKKWALRSGITFNELGQSIANVSYLNTNNSFGLTASDFFIQNTTVERITSNPNYIFVSNSLRNSLSSTNFQSGDIDQRLKYLELPLEVSYAILHKNKTSIRLNTGGFVGKLIGNEMLLNGNVIGETLDVNNLVYGTQMSSTLQYRLYKQTHFFVEPGLNYYFNPLNNQSFNQFQWALHFGLNVGF